MKIPPYFCVIKKIMDFKKTQAFIKDVIELQKKTQFNRYFE